MQAIILAGGKGRRLLPYTTVLPKPLMPIGDYSILDIILKQLSSAGFSDIVISTGYLHELICAYIKSRNDLDINLRFSHEMYPLGTVGPLKLINGLDETFLVMNGDILSDLNYVDLFEYHKKKNGIATIATYKRDVHIDFGVLQYDETNKIHSFIEKPTYHFNVSMGIYVFNKKILSYIPEESPFGFDNLMYALTEEKKEVYSYPHNGFWLDIGRPDDYARAIEEFEDKKELFLS